MTETESALQKSITALNGVGDKTATLLGKLGIETVQDLLFHLPLRYQDRTRLTPIGATLPGMEYQVQGEIELTQLKYGRRRSLLCRISDGTGAMTLRFFYFNKSQQNNLARGRTIRCYGRVSGFTSQHEMIHPEYRLINEDKPEQVDENLIAVYPATEGLQQNRLRKLTEQALHLLHQQPAQLIELLPTEVLTEKTLPELASALQFVHRPPPEANVSELVSGTHPAQKRLAYEELVSMFLGLQRMRQRVRKYKSWKMTPKTDRKNRLLTSLSFELTTAQSRVLTEIEQDMSTQIPMMRLVQGDVGSGKTVVAAIATLNAITSGFKTAVMAPTELLSEQHFQNFSQWFEPLGIKVVCLTGKMKKTERDELLPLLTSEEPIIVIGTHALFQKTVSFNRLGLVIIDEQHRFGVHQRLSLLEKGVVDNFYPHQLIMTATPIPRTLTMSAYADLDVSVIDELPPGRKPVNTVVINNEKREEIIQRINTAAEQGRQIYWVCTLIEESESLQNQAATETHEYLTEVLNHYQIGLIHGRLSDKQKHEVMSQFKSGHIHILVATTVIEVGVDVPNASLMIIENAERLGLAQLHQLRGRIGRGSQHSDCVLMYQPPLNELSRERLEIMRSSNDGFVIAEKDLQLRGPGELMGTRQSGLPEMHIADLARDTDLLNNAKKTAEQMEKDFPTQSDHLISRWQRKKAAYGKV